jgi:DNA-binding transcriptional MerR regulator
METFTSAQIAVLFDVSSETVRAWAIEFEKYLSPDANPGGRRNRRFTEDDFKVFSLVSQMKAMGKTFPDVHVALANGERGEMPEISTEKLNTLASQDIASITAQMQRLQNELQAVQNERDHLLERLEALRQIELENARLQSERDSEKRRAEIAEARVQDLTNRLIELQMEAGQARGELMAVMRLLRMQGVLPEEKEKKE